MGTLKVFIDYLISKGTNLRCEPEYILTSRSEVKFLRIMSVSFQRAGWISDSNIYEVNLRQYTPEGSFNAFAREMPRLKDMGIEILWFMPITPISHDRRKGSLGSYYACSDYLSVNPEFGTLDDFKGLVRQAHELGGRGSSGGGARHT